MEKKNERKWLENILGGCLVGERGGKKNGGVWIILPEPTKIFSPQNEKKN